MSRHRIALRQEPLTCRKLHLDQVYIMFRPSTAIGEDEFMGSDATEKSWYPETQQILVHTTPGVRNVFFTVDPDTPSHVETISHPNRSLVYSAALSWIPVTVTAGTESNFWCRTYRPIRDLPVAFDLNQVTELDIELFFPLLQGGSGNSAPIDLTFVPDYRIYKVYIEFSIDR